jgi:tRNA splicing endonuclease
VRNRSLSELIQRGLDDFETERGTLELVEAVYFCEDGCRDDQARNVLSDEREDGFIRVRDVDEHAGVTDER